MARLRSRSVSELAQNRGRTAGDGTIVLEEDCFLYLPISQFHITGISPWG
jgi:hypothetical protein